MPKIEKLNLVKNRLDREQQKLKNKIEFWLSPFYKYLFFLIFKKDPKDYYLKRTKKLEQRHIRVHRYLKYSNSRFYHNRKEFTQELKNYSGLGEYCMLEIQAAIDALQSYESEILSLQEASIVCQHISQAVDILNEDNACYASLVALEKELSEAIYPKDIIKKALKA